MNWSPIFTNAIANSADRQNSLSTSQCPFVAAVFLLDSLLPPYGDDGRLVNRITLGNPVSLPIREG
jgi:hypothetical protein